MSKKIVAEPMDIKDFLKLHRNKKKMSQTQVARAIGFTVPQFYSSWEYGKSPIPLKHIKPLAKVLGVSDFDIRNCIAHKLKKEIDEKWGIVPGKNEKKF